MHPKKIDFMNDIVKNDYEILKKSVSYTNILGVLDVLVNEYDMILREWQQAEEYQSGITDARKEYIRGILAMHRPKCTICWKVHIW